MRPQPASSSARPETERFDVLDGWRGLCAVIVALTHADFLGHYYDWPIVRNGHLFVDFFFVLSGFVLAHAYATRIRSRSDLIEYMIRRVGRLWPLHVALLVPFILIEVALLAVQSRGLLGGFRPAFSDSAPLSAIPTNLLLVQALGFHAVPTFNRPSWSISTELYGNLALGLMWFAVPFRGQLPIAVIGCVGCALLLLFVSPDYMTTVVGMAFFRCLCGLLAGLIAYAVYKRLSGSRPWWLEIAAVLSIGFYVHAAGAGILTMLAPFAFAAAIVVFAHQSGPLSAALRRPAFNRLGELSYSIYMVHYLLLFLVAISARLLEVRYGFELMQLVEVDGTSIKLIVAGGRWLMDGAAVAYIVAVVLVASRTYRWIERPWRRRFNAWSGTRTVAPIRRTAG